MKDEKDSLDQLFNHLNGQWDDDLPPMGHQKRFLGRLEGKKEQWRSFKFAIPVAAAIAVLLGLYIALGPQFGQAFSNENKMSAQAQETQLYFSGIIEKELAKVENQNSPETQRLVKDALGRLNALEQDYNNLTKELQEKGENKKIIHAMIVNLQTRISFLEEVLTKIENIKKIKQNYNENNNA